MKVKVIKRFRDKYTHTLYPYGATLTLPEKRVKEILSTGDYLEIIPTKKGTPAPAPEGPAPAADEEPVGSDPEGKKISGEE